jgi:hypothetical protein
MKGGILPDNSTFNHVAAKENEDNKKHIKLTHGGGVTSLTIDSKLVTYNGTAAFLLSDEHKRKLENRILFTYLKDLKQVPAFIYA